jgi:hypothetical protein
MITITPAYGRDYRSKAAAQADLDANKDFILSDLMSPWDGRPINRPQLVEQGHRQVNVRFGKGRKVAVLEVRP